MNKRCEPDLPPAAKVAADIMARRTTNPREGNNRVAQPAVMQASRGSAIPQGTVGATPINLRKAESNAKRMANADYDRREEAKNIVLAGRMVEAGRRFVGEDAIAALSGGGRAANLDQLRAEVARRESAYDKVVANASDPFSTPEWKAYIKASNDLKSAESGSTASTMAEVRARLMSRLSAEDASAQAGKVKVLKSASNRYGEDDLRSQLSEFYQLTGGKGESLTKLKVEEQRAWARFSDGVINLGIESNNTAVKANLFHEVGHFIETENPDINKAMAGFRSHRAEGKPVSLGNNYDADEMAYPGKFISPYVGKTGASTEVLSMGLERFSSVESMQNLYKQDPEHFFLVVGALL